MSSPTNDVVTSHQSRLESGTSDLKDSEECKSVIASHDRSWRRCCFTTIWPFTIYFGIVSLVTSVMTSYLTSQLTILEKQFGLSSSQSGLLLSMNDAGFLTSVLVASYLGRHAHIPRFLGVCGIIYGAAAITCIIPHFFATQFLGGSSFGINSTQNASSRETSQLCSPGKTVDWSLGASECLENSKQFTCSMFMAMLLISIGMFLQGVVNSAKIPLAQIYIDDNVPTMKSGIHIGTIVSLSVFGPALSYVVGGFISQIYVTLEESDLTTRDPRWIGAWWLGFLGFGSLAVVLSIPLFLFPKRLNDAHSWAVTSEENSTNNNKETILKRIMRFANGVSIALLRLVKRPVYVCIVLGTALRIFTSAGVLSFSPKYLQIHYGLSVYKSNIIIGFAGVGSSATGIFLSGILVRVLKLDVRGMIRALIITQIIAGLIFTSGIFLECPQPHIRGYDIDTGITSKDAFSVAAKNTQACIGGCNCDEVKFFPVCGSDDVTYFSPCHAGCQISSRTGYADCRCISNCTGSLADPRTGGAVPGTCSHECPLYMIFLVLQSMGNFIAGLGSVPATLALLRSVNDEDKALALGGNFFVSSLLGWFLGPIVMGAVIDTTCRLWNTSCSEDGSCAVYDVTDLRHKLHGVFGGVSVLYVTLFILAYFIFTSGKTGKPSSDDEEETEIKPPQKY